MSPHTKCHPNWVENIKFKDMVFFYGFKEKNKAQRPTMRPHEFLGISSYYPFILYHLDQFFTESYQFRAFYKHA